MTLDITESSTRRCRSPETWALAEADYRAGMTARGVCERYDLGLTALRDRAKAEGWRRIDQPDPEPEGPDLDLIAEFADVPAKDGADEAWGRMMWAIRQGRTREAQGWLKLHQQLSSMQIAEECFGSAERARRALVASGDPAFRSPSFAANKPAMTPREPDSPDSPDSFSSPGAPAAASPSEPPPPPNRAARRRAEALERVRR